MELFAVENLLHLGGDLFVETFADLDNFKVACVAAEPLRELDACAGSSSGSHRMCELTYYGVRYGRACARADRCSLVPPSCGIPGQRNHTKSLLALV